MLSDASSYGIRPQLVQWTISVCSRDASCLSRAALIACVRVRARAQTFLNVYLDKMSPLRSRLLYVVNKGEPEKARCRPQNARDRPCARALTVLHFSGGIRVWSPDECVGMAPALVPNTGKSKVRAGCSAVWQQRTRASRAALRARQMTVHHHAHVEYFRQDLARFFTFKNAEIDPADMVCRACSAAAALALTSLSLSCARACSSRR